jgi:DNA-directed RNA polymerase I subunit RPA2
VQRNEESDELGGYFIINGIEKIIRLLLVNRRNFPLAVVRPSFTNRGPSYTPYGIIVRSVRPDETSQTNVLHYLDDGNVTFRFSWRKNEYLVPLVMILKALVETNDREIFESLIGPPDSKGFQNTFLTQQVESLLTTYKSYKLYSKTQTRSYLGEKFRVVLGVPDTMSNYEVGTEFLRKIVLVHLGCVDVKDTQNLDKFKMLVFMCRKLYALASGECAVDNPDAVQNQEILLGGFLYAQILKEKLEDLLAGYLRLQLREYLRVCSPARKIITSRCLARYPPQVLDRPELPIPSLQANLLKHANALVHTEEHDCFLLVSGLCEGISCQDVLQA